MAKYRSYVFKTKQTKYPPMTLHPRNDEEANAIMKLVSERKIPHQILTRVASDEDDRA
jgi:hypothetical protein